MQNINMIYLILYIYSLYSALGIDRKSVYHDLENKLVQAAQNYNVNKDYISYETLKKIENITNEFIKNYPKDSSINNIVLGGLNELTLSSVGYDLANIINTNRYDFNSIGNKDSIITINGGKVCINLHSYYYGNTFNYINNYYLQRNIDNPYNLDIMSFIGPSSVDITNRIITIPPLMSNDMGCSIYQIEISMQDGDYKRFLIQPIMNTELIPTSRLLLYK